MSRGGAGRSPGLTDVRCDYCGTVSGRAKAQPPALEPVPPAPILSTARHEVMEDFVLPCGECDGLTATYARAIM